MLRRFVALVLVGGALVASCGLDSSGVAAEGGVRCETNGGCDDDNLCTVDRCEAGTCASSPVADGEAPVDVPGDCRHVVCQGGLEVVSVVPEDADDENDCTDDLCTPDGTATHTPRDGESCQYGTSLGTCNGTTCEVVCTPGGAECDDGEACTLDFCNEATLTCGTDTISLDNQPVPGLRDDPADCRNDVCLDGAETWQPDDTETPVQDENVCDAEVCSRGVSVHVPGAAGVPCSGGFCNELGQCAGCGIASDCGADNECTTWSCSPDGICTAAVLPDGTPLADDVAGDCTGRFCNAGQPAWGADDADVPGDANGNDCTQPGCSNGSVVTVNVPQGTSKPDCASTPTNCLGGACNGAGACSLKANGQSCGTSACSGTNDVDYQCYSGVCQTVTTPCAPLACVAAQCACTADNQCGQNQYCSLGTCTAKLANGGACSASAQCVNGNCREGVCCSADCTATCESCDAAKTAAAHGTCAFVDPGHDPLNACGADCCKSGGVCCNNPSDCQNNANNCAP